MLIANLLSMKVLKNVEILGSSQTQDIFKFFSEVSKKNGARVFARLHFLKIYFNELTRLAFVIKIRHYSLTYPKGPILHLSHE